MREKPFRVTIILGEYDTDGFWNVFEEHEISRNKDELISSFTRISNDCKNYIDKRIV